MFQDNNSGRKKDVIRNRRSIRLLNEKLGDDNEDLTCRNSKKIVQISRWCLAFHSSLCVDFKLT